MARPFLAAPFSPRKYKHLHFVVNKTFPQKRYKGLGTENLAAVPRPVPTAASEPVI